MSFYTTDFNKLRQEPGIAPLFEALERGFKKYDIDYYLVGALARDVWMRGMNDIKPKRTTGDVDFGILIKDIESFYDLKKYLIEKEGFSPSRDNAFVLIWKSGLPVDFLPFGAIEKEGKVTVRGTGMTTIYVDGFNEVYEEGMPDVEIEEKHRFKVCTLPGIILLKLIAWDDRPEMRREDITDIADIIKHFYNIFSEIIFENYTELLADLESIDVSSRVLGIEIGNILKRSKRIAERIDNILKANLNDPEKCRLANLFASELEISVEEAVKIIQQIITGIETSAAYPKQHKL